MLLPSHTKAFRLPCDLVTLDLVSGFQIEHCEQDTVRVIYQIQLANGFLSNKDEHNGSVKYVFLTSDKGLN